MSYALRGKVTQDPALHRYSTHHMQKPGTWPGFIRSLALFRYFVRRVRIQPSMPSAEPNSHTAAGTGIGFIVAEP